MPRVRNIAVVTVLVLATVPAFFEIYRTAAFKTTPYDDYAPQLQYLVGHGGAILPSPFGYRILAVIAAMPLYYLPTYRFSNLHGVGPDRLHAIQAMSLEAYLATLLTAYITYRVARRWASQPAAVIVAALAFGLMGYVERVGIDPTALLTVAVLYAVWSRPPLFVPGVVVSAAVNEKIPLLFLAIFAARWLLARDRRHFAWYPQLAASALALAGYALVRSLIGLHGHEEQTRVAQFGSHAVAALKLAASPKGVLLDLLPTLVVFLVAIVVIRDGRTDHEWGDLAGPVVLIIAAVVTNATSGFGRIALYALPVFLPAFALVFDPAVRKTPPRAAVAESSVPDPVLAG